MSSERRKQVETRGGKVINVRAFETRMRVKMKHRTVTRRRRLRERGAEERRDEDRQKVEVAEDGGIYGNSVSLAVYAFFNSDWPVNSRRDSSRHKMGFYIITRARTGARSPSRQ